MTNEELKLAVTILAPSATYDETGEFLNAIITPADLRNLMKALRHKSEFEFNYLFCLTCVDWKTHLMMVYHLFSKTLKHTLVVKVKIDNIKEPVVETVSDIWKTAIFHEREVYDLFGVVFNHHEDLRRLLLDESWVGYPLRKNYVDENMISI